MCYARKLTRQIGKPWALAGALELDGKFIAISLGEICGDTLVCHIEKALPGYEGVWLAREPVEHEAFPAGSTRDFWLIRRGETVLWIETNLGPLDEAWLNGILTQLEEGGAA